MPKREGVSSLVHCTAGGLAGAMEVTIMYPTEYVKTQMQLQKAEAGVMKYRNSWHCAKTIVAERGPLALYRGLTSLLLGTVPKTALRFTAFGFLKNAFRDEQGKLSALRTLAAGMATGAVEASLVVTPVETLKTRLIHDQNSAKPKYRGLIHAARVIGAEEGLGGIYKGWTPTMAKQMGNQGVRFLVFEEIKKAFASGDGAPMAFWGKFLSGGTAGLVSVLATMPFDMVKTRMQGLEAAQYRSTLHCVQKVFAEEGLFAFWKGMAPRLPRVVFGQSITLSSYDTIVDILVGRGR
ncbi:SLC25A1 [Symbiodinium sp. KB8]|nr:SLC25A1 [Symbiodinium sp. KB8]